MDNKYDDALFDDAFAKYKESQSPSKKSDPNGWDKFQDTVDKTNQSKYIKRNKYNDDFDDDYDNDWKQWSEPEPEFIINSTPVDPYLIENHQQAESLGDDTLVVDADGYAFQRRNGEWFMTGSAYGSTEFSGAFPARIALLTKAPDIEDDDDIDNVFA